MNSLSGKIKMTELEEHKLVAFREKWLAIGLDCGPVDRAKFENAVCKLYGKLEKPITKRPLFIQCSSPLVALIFMNVIKKMDLSKLSSQLSSQLDSQLRSEKLEWLSYWGGQYWASWCAFYLFPYETFKNYEYKKDDLENLQLWTDISTSVNWWWSFEDFVFFSDKPKHIKFDDRKQLHCEDDKAVKYKDGYGLYVWHGVVTTEQAIMRPNEITVDMILKEDNQEVRRVLMERMGMRRFLLEAKPEILDQDAHKINWNRALFRIKTGEVFLYVTDPSTGRNYPIQVDPRLKTCEESDKWMWHQRKTWDGKSYTQLART